MTADYADYQTPQAHATAISTTGVGLLKFVNPVASGSGVTVAGGVTSTLASLFAIGQPTWEFGATLSLPAGAGTVPFARFSFDWFDPSGTLRVGSDNVEVPLGNGPANLVTITGRGPCKGAKLTVSLRNGDPAQTLTVSYVVSEASHTFDRTQFEQTSIVATPPIGFTYVSSDPGTRFLATAKPSIAASGNVKLLLPVAYGKWRWTIDNSGQANAVNVQLQTVTGLGVIAGLNLYNAVTAAAAVTLFEVSFSSAPYVIVLTNQGTTGTITPTVNAVFEPY